MENEDCIFHHYEANVSRKTAGGKYLHFFGTHERSMVSRREAVEVAKELRARFPEPEFKVEVSGVTQYSQTVRI